MVIVGRVLLVMGRSCLYYPVSAAAEAEERSDTESTLLETSFEAFGKWSRELCVPLRHCRHGHSRHQSELASEVGLFDLVRKIHWPWN